MSGILAAWCRDGGPVDRSAFEQAFAEVQHRAVDGHARWASADGSAIMDHQHFWVTPEEVGERQPRVSGDVVVAFDGRLDNRDALAAALELTGAEARALSDATLVMKAYERWAEQCVERLQGPFALVVWDGRRQRFVCARDRLGRRALYYRLEPGLFVVASEASAVVAWPSASRALDDVFLAHYFAIRVPPDGRTLFAEVRGLLPAHMLIVDRDEHARVRYWSLHFEPLANRTDDEYAEHFRELLDGAVRRRMRTVGTPGVMMSGGLDSPSVAALAANQLRQAQPGARLRVFSYVFDELIELDERRWMAPMVARYDLDQTLVVADDAWPLHDLDRWVWHLGGPGIGPFDGLNARVYAAAHQAGVRVLLTGASSDGLFIGAESWLADLVADGRYREAATEVLKFVRHMGLRPVLRSASVRRLAARLVGRSGRNSIPSPPWLTPLASARLQPGDEIPYSGVSRRRQLELQAVLRSIVQDRGIGGGGFSPVGGVDVWDPFSDLELVQFMLSIPAHALYNRGLLKNVLIRAMKADLPSDILQRVRRSDISPLFHRGVRDARTKTIVDGLLGGSGAMWRQYVAPRWLEAKRYGPKDSGASELVVWRCLASQWWLRRGTDTRRLPIDWGLPIPKARAAPAFADNGELS